MNIPVSEAKAQFLELVRRAEEGDDIVVTRHGQPVARIVSAKPALTPGEISAIIKTAQDAAASKARPGPDAAHSQDFLYDENGLPA